MPRSDPGWGEFVEWVRAKPPEIQRMMIEWPPACVVKTVKGVTLLIPAPGVEGEVHGYTEDGKLIVVARTSIPHPEHDWGRDPETKEPLPPGTLARARIDPVELRLIREGRWTSRDVREALHG